jgi:hypothetical protein
LFLEVSREVVIAAIYLRGEFDSKNMITPAPCFSLIITGNFVLLAGWSVLQGSTVT